MPRHDHQQGHSWALVELQSSTSCFYQKGNRYSWGSKAHLLTKCQLHRNTWGKEILMNWKETRKYASVY